MRYKDKKVDLSRYVKDNRLPATLYGLDGVCKLFDVKKTTASKYVNSFLAGAVSRGKGKKLVIDTKKALELYGVTFPERLVL